MCLLYLSGLVLEAQRVSYWCWYHSSIHRYRWAFIPEVSDDSGLEVRRQGIHQREFKPYVVRLAKLLRKKAKVLHSFQFIFVKYKQVTFVRYSISYVQLPLCIRLINYRSLPKKIVSFLVSSVGLCYECFVFSLPSENFKTKLYNLGTVWVVILSTSL